MNDPRSGPDPALFLPGASGCPWSTDTPGLGGYLDGIPEHFEVDERLPYEPEGTGDHHFVQVRKRGLSSGAARRLVAEAAGVDPREVGMAGQKDRVAVTTQWMSLPAPPINPADPDVEILQSVRHPRKLKTGHVAGNRFSIRLRGVDPGGEPALPAIAEALHVGVPNYFGPQRFGRDARSVGDALRMFGGRRPRGRGKREIRFLASVLQSVVFNRWLGARVEDGLLHRALEGDVMRTRARGGLFVCEDVDREDGRARGGEIDPTGPMPGPKCMPAVGPAGQREAHARAEAGWDDGLAAQLARYAPGTRREARIIPKGLKMRLEGDDLLVRFTLPAGAYATVVLGEIAKHPIRRAPLGHDGPPTDHGPPAPR